jgi:hypothetical protein
LKISIVAWGSIVWDVRNLAIVDAFKPIGPSLPVEFCRVSRDGRLTLVIDEVSGTPCNTYSAISAFADLDAAIDNLRCREGMPGRKGVGFIVPDRRRASVTALERHPQTVKTIGAWARTRGFDASVWTALESNFKEKTGKSFSVKAAIRYLEALDKDARKVALTYIRNAPVEIQTPLRDAVDVHWRAP